MVLQDKFWHKLLKCCDLLGKLESAKWASPVFLNRRARVRITPGAPILCYAERSLILVAGRARPPVDFVGWIVGPLDLRADVVVNFCGGPGVIVLRVPLGAAIHEREIHAA